MKDSVVELVRRRASDLATRTDQTDVVQTELHALATLDALATAEHEIGHPLPTFLRELYLVVVWFASWARGDDLWSVMFPGGHEEEPA